AHSFSRWPVLFLDKLFLLEKSFHPEPKSVSPNFTQLAHFQALETSRPSSARPQAPVHGHSTPALSLSAAQHAVTAGSATSRSEPTTSPAPNPRGWRALSSRGFLVTHRRIFSAETLGHRRGRVEAAPGLSAPAGTGRRRGSAADAGGDLSGRRGALQRRGGAGVGGGPAGAGPGARVRGRRRGMARARVWTLVAGVLLALALARGRAAGAQRASGRPRGCADRPEELLEQLYGRLAAGVLGAFHHALQLGPREQARNASCPAGGRPADRRFRPPANLRSVSPWAYRISYDPARYPRYLPEAYCLCAGCLTGPRGAEELRFRSAPVYVPAVVLRRTPACAGGRAVYAEEKSS
uniref:Interleukin 17D n=1 Tax=Equus caballus TaxID=9796 RepID=A0A3Q2HCA2_HORSE